MRCSSKVLGPAQTNDLSNAGKASGSCKKRHFFETCYVQHPLLSGTPRHRKIRRKVNNQRSRRCRASGTALQGYPSDRQTVVTKAVTSPVGEAVLDPTATGSSSRTVSSGRSPEPEVEGSGGDNNGGWKSPPGGGGGGGSEENEGWWERYFEWWGSHNPFSVISLGLRMRMAADPSFAFKLMVECGLDASIIIVVNLLARRERFVSELEFVLSQIAVSLLNDFALVYLLAPTPECSVLQRGSLRAKLAELPAHVFQRAPSGIARGYTLWSRGICFFAKAVQYGTVGLVMGTTGSSLVLALTTVRTRLDKDYKPPPTYQPVLGTGIGWLLFMSGSSNIRYNLINFVEDFAYERFPGPKSKALSIALRFSNNIFGAHAWMHMARRLNLNRPRKQKRAKKEPEGDLISEMPPAH